MSEIIKKTKDKLIKKEDLIEALEKYKNAHKAIQKVNEDAEQIGNEILRLLDADLNLKFDKEINNLEVQNGKRKIN